MICAYYVRVARLSASSYKRLWKGLVPCPISKKEDLAECTQTSYLPCSRILMLCAFKNLDQDNKEDKSWWM
jgi:hypothetical protein